MTVGEFFETANFWWGVPVGTIVGGVLGAAIQSRTSRKSDERQAAAATERDRVEAERADKRQSDQLTREACAEFSKVCVEIFEISIDKKGIFNTMRDALLTAEGEDDPNVSEKIDYAEIVSNETSRIGNSYTQLKLVAPTPILDKAMVLNAAIIQLLKAITHPEAKPMLASVCSQALDQYTNSVRTHLGLDVYSQESAQREVASFMEIQKQQIDQYLAEQKRRGYSNS